MAGKVAKKYDFNSVGVLYEDDIYETAANLERQKPRPYGIITPLQLTVDGGGLFKTSFDVYDQVHDNFKNLLLTNHGDRLGFYDFGANLQELTHELGSENGDTIAINRIRNAVNKYMPFLNLKTFEAYSDNRDNEHVAKVKIRIVYGVQGFEKDRAMELTMFVTG